jgi:hypothetical protein
MSFDGAMAVALLAAGAVAGAAIERYRNARRERPLPLSETPRAWARVVRESIGLSYSLVGGVAAVCAFAVLLLPALSGTGAPDEGAQVSGRVLGAKLSLPDVQVLRRTLGRAFRVKGVSFRIFTLAPAQAGLGLHRPAGRGMTWLRIGVDVRNLAHARFRPSAVAYRLKDERGRSYSPDVSGGTGPASLGRNGMLDRGELYRARLSFRVSRSAGRVKLVFEPLPDGSLQVEVPLGP